MGLPSNDVTRAATMQSDSDAEERRQMVDGAMRRSRRQ
jgi:hypothetical protein